MTVVDCLCRGLLLTLPTSDTLTVPSGQPTLTATLTHCGVTQGSSLSCRLATFYADGRMNRRVVECAVPNTVEIISRAVALGGHG